MVGIRLKGEGGACIRGVKLKVLPSAAGEMSTPERVENLDFAHGPPGFAPDGWFITTPIGSMNYHAERFELGDDKYGVVLKSFPQKNTERGSMMQRFSALPYRARHLVFEADMKADVKGNYRAGLFISPNGLLLGNLSDKQQSQVVTDKSWRRYRAEVDVPADAKFIDMGIELLGAGAVYIKNVSLSDGPLTAGGNQSAAPITGQELYNLKAFAKLFACVRFFDPAVNRSAYWWNQYAVWAANEIVSRSKTEPDRARLMRDLLLPIDPSVKIVASAELAEAPANDGRQYCHWVHHGYGIEPGAINAGYFSQKVPQSADNDKPASSVLTHKIDDELCCVINTACVEAASETPSALTISNRGSSRTPNGNDRITRLGAAVVAWAVLRNFYPYDDVAKVDWDGYLESVLKNASQFEGKDTFYLMLNSLAAALGDDQARAFCDDIEGAGVFSTQYTSHFIFHLLPDNMVCISASKQDDEMNGAALTQIGERPIMEELKMMESDVSAATPQWKHYRGLQLINLGSLYSELVFSDKESQAGRNKETSSRVPREVPFVTTVTPTGIMTSHLINPRPDKVSFVTPGVLYIDLTRCSASELHAALQRARQVDGVVFDCRGELRLPVQSFLGALTDKPIPSPQFMLPVISKPDFQDVTYDSVGFNCRPEGKRLRAKAVFIADESSVGNMETALCMVQNSKLGTIVGSTTAGTAGGIALASLPGNYYVSWTCIRTLKPDGSRLHGVGVEPDKKVQITRKALQFGIDELLEAAKGECMQK